MNIRTMTIDDYEQIYALWISTPGMGLNDVDDSREGIDRYLQRNPTTCFVAEEDGRILGAILCGNDGRRGYISHTAVTIERRREGIGRALVQAALKALKDLRISKVALVVFKHNETGKEYWRALGFSTRTDLDYCNLALIDLTRIDT